MLNNIFYKYIHKKGNYYYVIKNNEILSVCTDLESALLERDILSNLLWDMDDFVKIDFSNIENPYYYIDLPEFNHNPSFITIKDSQFRVYKKGKLWAIFISKKHAIEFQNKYGGELDVYRARYQIQKNINGTVKYFGTFIDYDECIRVRDELIKNDWRK